MIGAPVSRSAVRISVTLAHGLRCFSSVHAPVTCGAAIEVPLNDENPPGTDDVICEPGASRLRKEAALEKLETSSIFVVDATDTADEMQPGELSASPKPSLPDAITVAMP